MNNRVNIEQEIENLNNVKINFVSKNGQNIEFLLENTLINYLATLDTPNSSVYIEIELDNGMKLKELISFQNVKPIRNTVNKIGIFSSKNNQYKNECCIENEPKIKKGKYSFIHPNDVVKDKFLSENGWGNSKKWYDICIKMDKKEIFKKDIIFPKLDDDLFLSQNEEYEIFSEGKKVGFGEEEIDLLIKESVNEKNAMTHLEKKSSLKKVIIFIIIGMALVGIILFGMKDFILNNESFNIKPDKQITEDINNDKKEEPKQYQETKLEEEKLDENIDTKKEKIVETQNEKKIEKEKIIESKKIEVKKIKEEVNLRINPKSINFVQESIKNKKLIPQIIMIKNNGTNKVVISKIEDGEGFEFAYKEEGEWSDVLQNIILESSDFKEIYIRFNPKKAKLYEESVKIYIGDNVYMTIPVSGKAVN